MFGCWIFLLKVKFLVTYWVSRWILNFQLKAALFENWILDLPPNIEFRIAESVHIEHVKVANEYWIFVRIWIFVEGMPRRNIEYFLTKPKYEKLEFFEMN